MWRRAAVCRRNGIYTTCRRPVRFCVIVFALKIDSPGALTPRTQHATHTHTSRFSVNAFVLIAVSKAIRSVSVGGSPEEGLWAACPSQMRHQAFPMCRASLPRVAQHTCPEDAVPPANSDIKERYFHAPHDGKVISSWRPFFLCYPQTGDGKFAKVCT
jgi:hypothetical protein